MHGGITTRQHIPIAIIIETRVVAKIQPRKRDITTQPSICMTQVMSRYIIHMAGRWMVGQQVLLPQQVVTVRGKPALQHPLRL